MRLSVSARGFQLTPEMRALVERRILRVVGRHAARIRSVVVRLETQRDRRARSEDVTCSISLTLQERSRRIASHAANTRMQAAIDRAAAEVGQLLERELSLLDQAQAPARRSRRRGRMSAPAGDEQKPWAVEYWKPPRGDRR